jgi:hypothetical protein
MFLSHCFSLIQSTGKDKANLVGVHYPEQLLEAKFLRFVPPSAHGKTIVKALPPLGLPKSKKTNKFASHAFASGR